MSGIDQRIVEMQFDNKQFESGVKTTISTLDRLKQKLNFGQIGSEPGRSIQSVEAFLPRRSSFKCRKHSQ